VQNPLSGNATLRSVLEQISDFLRIEPGKIVNGAIEIALIWLGAWIAWRGVRLIARRIIARVTTATTAP